MFGCGRDDEPEGRLPREAGADWAKCGAASHSATARETNAKAPDLDVRCSWLALNYPCGPLSTKADVNRDRHERDRLVLRQTLGRHQEAAHLAKCVPHRVIEGRFLVNFALRFLAQLGQIVGVAEAMDDPFVQGLQQRIVRVDLNATLPPSWTHNR